MQRKATIPHVCEGCGRTFLAIRSLTRPRRFCGHACANGTPVRLAARTARRDPTRREQRICAHCSTAFETWAANRQQYCSLACSVEHRRSQREARFWSHVDRDGPPPAHRPELGGCWLWTGALCGKGYGACAFGMRHVMTHRLSWELANGPIPEGLDVLHKCDVMRCVRPDHLYVGTQSDNNRDMWGRERRSHSKKLTADDVRAIREIWPSLPDWESPHQRQLTLAAEYGVTAMTIRDVIQRRIWKHVP